MTLISQHLKYSIHVQRSPRPHSRRSPGRDRSDLAAVYTRRTVRLILDSPDPWSSFLTLSCYRLHIGVNALSCSDIANQAFSQYCIAGSNAKDCNARRRRARIVADFCSRATTTFIGGSSPCSASQRLSRARLHRSCRSRRLLNPHHQHRLLLLRPLQPRNRTTTANLKHGCAARAVRIRARLTCRQRSSRRAAR